MELVRTRFHGSMIFHNETSRIQQQTEAAYYAQNIIIEFFTLFSEVRPVITAVINADHDPVRPWLGPAPPVAHLVWRLPAAHAVMPPTLKGQLWPRFHREATFTYIGGTVTLAARPAPRSSRLP
jgi:hypothetical protein